MNRLQHLRSCRIVAGISLGLLFVSVASSSYAALTVKSVQNFGEIGDVVTSSVSYVIPHDAAVGDIAYITLSCDVAPSVSNGWTEITGNVPFWDRSFWVFEKVIAAGDPGTVSWFAWAGAVHVGSSMVVVSSSLGLPVDRVDLGVYSERAYFTSTSAANASVDSLAGDYVLGFLGASPLSDVTTQTISPSNGFVNLSRRATMGNRSSVVGRSVLADGSVFPVYTLSGFPPANNENYTIRRHAVVALREGELPPIGGGDVEGSWRLAYASFGTSVQRNCDDGVCARGFVDAIGGAVQIDLAAPGEWYSGYADVTLALTYYDLVKYRWVASETEGCKVLETRHVTMGGCSGNVGPTTTTRWLGSGVFDGDHVAQAVTEGKDLADFWGCQNIYEMTDAEASYLVGEVLAAEGVSDAVVDAAMRDPDCPSTYADWSFISPAGCSLVDCSGSPFIQWGSLGDPSGKEVCGCGDCPDPGTCDEGTHWDSETCSCVDDETSTTDPGGDGPDGGSGGPDPGGPGPGPWDPGPGDPGPGGPGPGGPGPDDGGPDPGPGDCPPGYVKDANGVCVPEPEPPGPCADMPPCPDGAARDPETCQCPPDGPDGGGGGPCEFPPPCPVGYIVNENCECEKECPNPPSCSPGWHLDPESCTCVPDCPDPGECGVDSSWDYVTCACVTDPTPEGEPGTILMGLGGCLTMTPEQQAVCGSEFGFKILSGGQVQFTSWYLIEAGSNGFTDPETSIFHAAQTHDYWIPLKMKIPLKLAERLCCWQQTWGTSLPDGMIDWEEVNSWSSGNTDWVGDLGPLASVIRQQSHIDYYKDDHENGDLAGRDWGSEFENPDSGLMQTYPDMFRCGIVLYPGPGCDETQSTDYQLDRIDSVVDSLLTSASGQVAEGYGQMSDRVKSEAVSSLQQFNYTVDAIADRLTTGILGQASGKVDSIADSVAAAYAAGGGSGDSEFWMVRFPGADAEFDFRSYLPGQENSIVPVSLLGWIKSVLRFFAFVWGAYIAVSMFLPKTVLPGNGFGGGSNNDN